MGAADLATEDSGSEEQADKGCVVREHLNHQRPRVERGHDRTGSEGSGTKEAPS